MVPGKLNFSSIREINVASPDTWEGKIFLTLDIDWACDFVLADTISLIEKANVFVTWFITHDTPLLERLRNNYKFELGVHPNFNFLLNGDPRNGATAEEVIDRLLDIVPDAKSVRCHSMTQNSVLLQLFADKGLTHDCNHFIPEQAEISLKPWLVWNGLIKVPYFWEDDVFCLYSRGSRVCDLVYRPGLKVFDFHPIHIFLNTQNLKEYELTRPVHHHKKKLIKHRNQGYGTRNRLLDLLSLANA